MEFPFFCGMEIYDNGFIICAKPVESNVARELDYLISLRRRLAGDAGAESRAAVKAKGLPEAVDPLKVARHGSLYGMPFEGEESVVRILLKMGKRTKAVVGARKGACGKTAETGIPAPRLMKWLMKSASRCDHGEQHRIRGSMRT